MIQAQPRPHESARSGSLAFWDRYRASRSWARQSDHRYFRISREVSPFLTLLGLGHVLPDQILPPFLRGHAFETLVAVLFGIGSSVILKSGFSFLPSTGWRWLRFVGMGALGSVWLFGLGDTVASIHDGMLHVSGPSAWYGSLQSVPAFLVACALTGLCAVFFSRIERHRREAGEQRRLAEAAQRAAVRSRLAPHFIFNALNTLHAQIEADPKAAEATTERLADLFRQVVEAAGKAVIPLKQELAFVEAYLGIEQARLGDRLRVGLDIPEELESVEIPPLSLQVLVENAVKHGVAPLEQGGEVRIGAARREGDLYLWVEDPGTGRSAQRGTGTALDTLRQRLARPEDLTMERTATGFRVAFRWRQA